MQTEVWSNDSYLIILKLSAEEDFFFLSQVIVAEFLTII